MKEKHQETDALIRASLETLMRHLGEESRREFAALRKALDKGLATFESKLSASESDPAIQATVNSLLRISSDGLDRERQQADATVTQVLAANAGLQTTLADVLQQVDAMRTQAATTEADRKAAAAQHDTALKEHERLAIELDKAHAQLVDARVQIKQLQQTKEALITERAELKMRLSEVATAVSQRLSEALSKTLDEAREELRPIADARDVSPQGTSPAPTHSSSAAATSVPTAPKKVLQFSDQARDSKRIAMRQGTHISVENIPGELVDLSVGGAQVVLRQSVKPNQLVRLYLPTDSGELVAKARVVWVIYEHRETSLSVYRTGLKLTEVDSTAIERFISDFSATPLAQSGS